MRFKLAIVALGFASALPAFAADPPKELAPWLGKENTVDISGSEDHIPREGKLTLVFDAQENVVRVCTRVTDKQGPSWREDLAKPCEVTLNFVAGKRYCTYEEVKSGDAEVLVGCHRLRNSSIAMHPAAKQHEPIERHDFTFYLLEPTATVPRGGAITLDSPSALTHFGAAHLHN